MSLGPGGGLQSGSNLLGLELCALTMTFPPWMGGHVSTCTGGGEGAVSVDGLTVYMYAGGG